MVAGPSSGGTIEDELGLAQASTRPATAGRRASLTTTTTTSILTTTPDGAYGAYDEVAGEQPSAPPLHSRYSNQLYCSSQHFPRAAYMAVCAAGELANCGGEGDGSWNTRLQATMDMPEGPDPLLKYRRLGQLCTVTLHNPCTNNHPP
jgi:hypothetical protein